MIELTVHNLPHSRPTVSYFHTPSLRMQNQLQGENGSETPG